MNEEQAPVAIARWQGGGLVAVDQCDPTVSDILVADSWRVLDGAALALDLHRQRFSRTAAEHLPGHDVDAFWDAAIAGIPRTGDWFPRVELQSRAGAPVLVARVRPAPPLARSVTVVTHDGVDPRRSPLVKGPDLAALLRLRSHGQSVGADETVIVSPDGFVAEGTTTAIAWWRGDALCVPSPELARVPSVTATVLVGLAGALGIDVLHESVGPAELDGLEVWALNALHGPRILTRWVDGPALAEQPGRLALWRDKLGALRRRLP